ncbi:MAG: peptidoglycan-binding protein [Clostridiales bacterium]|jgi:peptidoglycan hydrolase-like protein with peptidoglycan-binding domain|nr:peptidoglycan-binding protein [Clostridiales bacterium]MDR2750221.1 peptidoglycan-binding protein [Clostridiales bacterium]
MTVDVLVFGNSGLSVRDLKTLLTALEYPVTSTDMYDESTVTAVVEYQRQYRRLATGTVDENCLEEIRKSVALPKEPVEIYPELKVGDEGIDVLRIQKVLAFLGFYTGALDGVFGPKTELSVKQFQSASKLDPNGIVGDETRESLDKHIAIILLPPSIRQVLREGDQGEIVELLQDALSKSGFYTGDVDGLFSSMTKNAVERFQKAAGITGENGIVGPKTWDALDWEGSSVAGSGA